MNEQVIEIKEEKKHHSWDESIRTILIAFLLAITFRSFLYEPFHIPSGSMKSNLLIGDYLFVSKFAYGYSRYSFPLGIVPLNNRVMADAPERGDVVVFRLPANPRIDYIKRLMGLPGDRIQLKKGIVYINGEPLARERIDNYMDDEYPGNVRSVPRFAETLPEGREITILKERRFGLADDTDVFTVPPGHYFFLGDNRDNSRDSRFMMEVGFVPEENLIGRAEMIFFSIDGTAKLYNPLTWLPALRFDRFFKSIE